MQGPHLQGPQDRPLHPVGVLSYNAHQLLQGKFSWSKTSLDHDCCLRENPANLTLHRKPKRTPLTFPTTTWTASSVSSTGSTNQNLLSSARRPSARRRRLYRPRIRSCRQIRRAYTLPSHSGRSRQRSDGFNVLPRLGRRPQDRGRGGSRGEHFVLEPFSSLCQIHLAGADRAGRVQEDFG